MKKLFLAVGLCVVGFVVAPIASAGAAVKGTCEVNGTATFLKHNLNQLSLVTGEETTGYTFVGSGGKCLENNTPPAVPVTFSEVKNGEFKGTCLGAATNVKDGEGELEVNSSGKKEKFELDIEGTALGVVNLIIEKSTTETEEAKGKAAFFTSTNELAPDCLLPAGVTKLQFTAVATGEIG
jgi:hypothetical protein